MPIIRTNTSNHFKPKNAHVHDFLRFLRYGVLHPIEVILKYIFDGKVSKFYMAHEYKIEFNHVNIFLIVLYLKLFFIYSLVRIKYRKNNDKNQ